MKKKQSSTHGNVEGKKYNPRVKKVMQFCGAALRRKVPVGKTPYGCGTQGCVFPSSRDTVVKVSVPNNLDDGGATAWLTQHRGRHPDQHPALPVVTYFGYLGNCLKGAGVRGKSYITVREDLHDVPRTPGWDDAMELLYEYGHEWVYTGQSPFLFLQQPHIRTAVRDLKKNPEYSAAWNVFFCIFNLHLWLWPRGLVMYDAWDDNIGLRKIGGQPVVRDIGLLEPRPMARPWVKSSWTPKYIDKHATVLGGLRHRR